LHTNHPRPSVTRYTYDLIMSTIVLERIPLLYIYSGSALRAAMSSCIAFVSS
jgi:hypothetical protein